MIKLDYIINYYVAIVSFAAGFYLSGYITEGSFPSISLFIILLGSGVAIFSGYSASNKNYVEDAGYGVVVALAAGGMAIGWAVGNKLWGSG